MGRMLKNMATAYTCEVFLLKYKEKATRICPITLVQTPMSRNKGKNDREGEGAGAGAARRGLARLGNKPKLNKKCPLAET